MKKLMTSLAFFSAVAVMAQSFEINIAKDTVNMTDANGKKQGKWIIWGHAKKNSCYQMHQKIEEGMYKDNKRIGSWTEYNCNSTVKSIMPYVNGKPEGEMKLYFESGKIKEQGTWKQNRWVGNYKLYDESGGVTEIMFDDKGKEISKKITPAKKEVPSNKK